MKNNFNVVGKNKEKIDALGLAIGKEKFTDDEHFNTLLHARILTSPYPHARIKKINTKKAKSLAGVKAVLTYEDLPRIAHTTAGQGYPEPSPYDTFTLDNKVRFIGDRVAAVAAISEEIAEQALKLIEVEYEILKPIFNPCDSLKEGAPIIHDEKEAHAILPYQYEPLKNLIAHVDVETGNVEEGFRNADVVVEHEFETQYASHCCMEPHIVICYLDERNRLVIRTSTQVPFHVRRIIAERIQIPAGRIRVIKPRIGGGFGAKQEVLIEDICAALTLKTGLPVKLQYSRKEEFISSRTRHPQTIDLKMGVSKSGIMNSIQMKILMNNGAYGAHGLTVGCNAGSKTLPLLNKARNVRFILDTVYTNLPVGGAYRGYGATQPYFAIGTIMDEIAEKIGIDVLELWKLNHIKSGEGSPVFAMLGEGRAGVEMKIDSCELDKCIELGVKEIGWYEKRNKKRKEGNWRFGVGMVCLMQGSSIPEIDMGAASIKMNDDGSFNLLIGATDLGTGSDTVLSQIAAEELCCDLKDIIVYSSDTDFTPFDVGAYASSTTYLSGMAVKDAATKVKQQIIDVASKILKTSNIQIKDSTAIDTETGKSVKFSDIAKFSLYERGEQFQIAAFSSKISKKSPPPFSAHFAEVAVDINTGIVKVLKYVAAVDCGTAINPQLAEGQTEGGVLNGISYALTEEFVFDEKGRMLNPNFMNYKIFNTVDMPEIKAIIVDSYEPTGPFGAKSVSEICINGPIPAIANAIYDAVGIRLYRAPFTPERVWSAIKSKK